GGERRGGSHCGGGPGPRGLEPRRVAGLLRRRRYQHRLWIDAPSGDFGCADALPIDPYVLGALLGDGSLSGSSLRFSTAQSEMLERIVERATPAFALRAAGGYDWRIVQTAGAHRAGVAGVTPNGLMEALRSLGLWGKRAESKFIPDGYLNASRADRVELLRGLMGTDSWVARWGSTRFCSTSERLAHQVAELVRSLGGWCSIRSRRTTFRSGTAKKAGRTAFVCNIHHPDPRGLFHLSLERARARAAPRRRWRPVFTSIERAGAAETQCIAVTHPSRLHVTDDYVVTHNTP